MPSIANIQSTLEAIEQNTLLWDEAQFAARTDMLHMMEGQLLDALDALAAAQPHDPQITALHARAHALYAAFTRINEQMFQRLRTQIAAGNCDHATLWQTFLRNSAPHPTDDLQYDSLDVLVNGIVRAEAPPEEPAALEAEMVGYQPTPMRLVLDMVQRAQLGSGDVFYDLGSGLGHVPIVVSLLSGARAVGIEVDPGLCAYARRCATALSVNTVEFRNEDARTAAFAGGTVFFLYTPFRGTMLRTVLDRLHMEAEQRPIRICTYGPCTATVAQQRWLASTDHDPAAHTAIVLFESNP